MIGIKCFTYVLPAYLYSGLNEAIMKQIKVKVLLRYDKPLSDKTFPIWIRITSNRKSSYMATGYSCQEEEWNPEASRLYEIRPRITQKEKTELNPSELKALQKAYTIVKVNSLSKKINSEIDKRVRKILSAKDKLEANEERLTSKGLKKLLVSNDAGNSDKSFIQYWENQNRLLERNEAFGTLKTNKSILKELKESYLKGKDLKFDEINIDFLEEYKGYLKREGYAKGTIHNHLKTFRSILYKAIKEPTKNYFSQDKNPFFAFKLEADQTQRKKRLIPEEIKRIEDLKLEKGARIETVRNMFLFSFYCAGVRIGDLIQFKWSNIQEGRLEYKMGKNDKVKSIKLLPKALIILKEYFSESCKQEDYIFPLLEKNINRQNKAHLKNQVESKSALFNLELKEIAKLAVINKTVTSHIARHSFADIARKNNASILDIQKLLGHSDSKTTQIYLNSVDVESQDEAHEKAFQGI